MTRIASLSVREAVRGFARQKSVFVVAVLTLALGVGLSTAMFSVLYGVILRPLSYGDARRLVVAWAGYEGSASERDLFNEQALVQWRQTLQAFDGVAGFRYTEFTLLERGEPTDLEGVMVSPDLFTVLNVQAELGTVFSPTSALAEQGKVVLLSHRLWRQRFGADPAVAGKSINLGGEIKTVAGVMPDDFDVPSQTVAVWAPLPTAPASTGPKSKTLIVIARLRRSVSMAQAQADADRVAHQLALEYPETHRAMRIHLVPFFDELTKSSRPSVVVGSVAALLVLLICCANVSNLLLVRAIVRRPEFATRVAIGARRRHLLGVILSESLLLAISSGLVGAGLARWMIDALLRLSPIALPRAAAIGRGFQVSIVAGSLMIIATLLISLPAAWEVGRLKQSWNAATGARSTSRRFAGQVIVMLEVAIALTLVCGSGLMARTILALRDANPGWKTDHLLAAQIFLPKSSYRAPHQVRQFYETFLERLRATPRVVSVAASSAMPAGSMGADFDVPIQVVGHSAANGGQASVRVVTPGFFKTLGIPLLQGRDLEESDGDPNVRRVVVNRAFVKKHLADSPSVVGTQVKIFLGAPQTYQIVGAVGDVRHHGMLRDPKPEFYLPFASRPFNGMGVMVRTVGDPMAFAPAFRNELWALDPALPIAFIDSMENMVKDTWSDRTFITILIVCFTVVVVALTIVGVFSVMTYLVSRQVREIAIHMAVGAQGGDVVRLVMGQSAPTLIAGVALGLVGAWMLGRGLSSLIYGVSASDPRVLLTGAAGVLIVAAIGAYLPSSRAANIDPMMALRME